MKHRLILLILFLFTQAFLWAQLPNLWYFGQNAGVDFSGLNPVPASHLMSTPAGCSISDMKDYYSNGQTVWGLNGIVYDGTNLHGDMQSTQAAQFVDIPDNDTVLLFTSDARAGIDGLRYNKIFNNRVVEKDHKLWPQISEKLAITRHCNRYAYWLLAHEWNSNAFLAFLVNENGLDTLPVQSQIGSVHSGNKTNAAGQMKFSMNGDVLGLVKTGNGTLELFHFNNTTGEISDSIFISGLHNPYGIEFDFNTNYVYVSTLSGKLWQFSLSSWNRNDIQNSKSLIASNVQLMGALQIADDHRIYLSIDNAAYLACITNPNSPGISCNYVQNFLYLNGKRCEAGLPQTHLPLQDFDVKGAKYCIGDTAFFEILGDTTRIDSVFWNFGDTLSTTDTSTLLLPYYIYPPFRHVYEFTVEIFFCDSSKEYTNYMEILGPPHANLGPDTSICENQYYALFGGAATSFLWSSGDTTPTISATNPGKYWVRLSNKCGESSDTVFINNIWPAPQVQLPNDTLLCIPDSLMLQVHYDSSHTVNWMDTIHSDSLWVKSPGIYYVEVENKHHCKAGDQIIIQYEQTPIPNLGQDTSICVGQAITFNGNYPGDYLWSTGEVSDVITVMNSGDYMVEVTNKCGIGFDTVHVDVLACEQKIAIPNAFSPNGDGINDKFIPYSDHVYFYKFQIFNRWGQLIFETSKPMEAWDGNFNGKAAPQGVYSWRVEYKDYYNEKYVKYGMLVLLR